MRSLTLKPVILQDMNPFCLSASDKDMVLLISNPGPPNLDVSRQLCTVYREITHDLARSVFFRLTHFCKRERLQSNLVTVDRLERAYIRNFEIRYKNPKR